MTSVTFFDFLTLLYKTLRFHVALRLFSKRSQSTSKCGKNISDRLADESRVVHATETGDKFSLMGLLARIQTLPYLA